MRQFFNKLFSDSYPKQNVVIAFTLVYPFLLVAFSFFFIFNPALFGVEDAFSGLNVQIVVKI